MTFTLSQAAALKKEIADKFTVALHFHDGCGGQYFSIDTPTPALQKSISDYLKSRNLQAVFSENGSTFSVVEGKHC